MSNVLLNIVQNFKINGEILSIETYGRGHINTTYLVTTSKQRYILQKINNDLFKKVDHLMHNINNVTSFLKKNYPHETTLTLVHTLDNKSYYEGIEGFYRIYDFIENSLCLQNVEEERYFYASAVILGEFSNMLSDFDASILYEIIPNFHNTPERYKQLQEAIKVNFNNRLSKVSEEIKFVESLKDYLSTITSLLNSNLMPLRVTHNDTKLNNVLFDAKICKGLAVIDLDTIMPGSICYDFGDSIRFGCNSSSEDEKDLSKVYFRLDLFEVFTKGYLNALKSITTIEKEHLVDGAILMTLECGMRFLADYLNGDTYFKINYSEHNLDRCHTQFKLVCDMLKHKEQMQKIVNKY